MSAAPTFFSRMSRLLNDRTEAHRADERGLALLDVLLGMAIFALIVVIGVQNFNTFRERAYLTGAVSDAKQAGVGLTAALTAPAGALPDSVSADGAEIEGLNLTTGNTVRQYTRGADGQSFEICVGHTRTSSWALYDSTRGTITGSGKGAASACVANTSTDGGGDAAAFEVTGATWDGPTRTITISGSGFDGGITGVTFNGYGGPFVVGNDSTITLQIPMDLAAGSTHTLVVTPATGSPATTSFTVGGSTTPATGISVTGSSYNPNTKTLTVTGTGFTQQMGVSGSYPMNQVPAESGATATEIKFSPVEVGLGQLNGGSIAVSLLHDYAAYPSTDSTPFMATMPDYRIDVTSASFDSATGVFTVKGTNFNNLNVTLGSMRDTSNNEVGNWTATVVDAQTARFKPSFPMDVSGMTFNVGLVARDWVTDFPQGDFVPFTFPASSSGGGGAGGSTPTASSISSAPNTITVTGTNLESVTSAILNCGGTCTFSLGAPTLQTATSLTFNVPAGPPNGTVAPMALVYPGGTVPIGNATVLR